MRTGLSILYRRAIALIAVIVMTGCTTTPTALVSSIPTVSTSITPLTAMESTPTSTGPWVQFENGQLVYRQDEQGNRIPDFSSVGYSGGTKPIPQVPVRITLSPQPEGDDTTRIQQAIDSISQRTPDAQGLRGTVLLQAGQYRVEGTLNIQASGVVLRGSGTGPDGTVLAAQGSPHTLVKIAGTGKWKKDGTTHNITDTYVPVGASSFRLDGTTGLNPGDDIIVQRPTTEQWIKIIGMDQIPPRPSGRPSKQWKPGNGLFFDRTITSIDTTTNQITLDAPLTNALEQQYTNAVVWRYTFPGRISQVGIENLRSDGQAFTTTSEYAKDGYSNSKFIQLDAVENGWMRDVVFEHYGNGISTGSTAKWITITKVQALNMGVIKVAAAPAAFSINSQLTLVQQCQVTGSYIHAWMTQNWQAGPNVITQCTATGEHMDAGPHRLWGTGMLYDNLSMPQGHFAIGNREYYGSGHGWAGANNVLWNCIAQSYVVQSPPTAQNWAIGCTGKITSPKFQGPQGYIDSSGQPVQPTSLYKQQLAERLRKQR